MSLDRIVAENNVDLQALERVRRRVFVVGRFNNGYEGDFNKAKSSAADGDEPATFLLSGREHPADYTDKFTGSGPLSYESFVKLVQPKIAEVVDESGIVPQVLQTIPLGKAPGQDESGESLAVLDPYNYFFLRAIATTEQGAFSKEQPKLQDYLNSDPGESIFKQIRSSLAAFCEFQPKHPELIDSLAKLFDACHGGKAVPLAYAEGSAFPVGLPERLIDYLYAEDTTQPFSLEGIDFSSKTWQGLQKDEVAREELANIIGAFRACLLTGTAEQYGGKAVGPKSLRSIAESKRSPEQLRREFEAARDAYNKLRQILRNRVLLSMVLQWVIMSIYDRQEVQSLGDRHSRDVLVQSAVRDGGLGLAPPVVRPDKEQQEAISATLSENLKELVDAVIAGDTSKLSAAMRDAADGILKNESMVKALRVIAAGRADGGAVSPENYQAFLDAAEVLLKDVVCATLFQKPVLNVAQLYIYASAELKTAYLAAEFLQPQSEVAIRRVAQSHLKEFQEKFSRNALLSEGDAFMAGLLGDLLGVIARPEVAEQVESNMRVIDRVLPIQLGKSAVARPSDIVSNEGGTTVMRTRAAVGDKIEVLVEEGVEQAALALSAGASAAQPSGPASAPDAGASAGVGASAEGATTQNGQGASDGRAASDGRRSSEGGANAFEDAIKKIVLGGLSKEDIPAGRPKAEDISKLAAKVRGELGPQIDEVKGVLEDDVKVFRQLLKKIYETYNEQRQDKVEFRNRVERLTLINMLLANQKELRIGDRQSNLYQMLIDMVMTLDAQKPEPARFLRENSLTKYFENEVFKDDDGEGMATLRNTLEVQARKSLSNVVKFVSELRGVKYLLDYLDRASDAEVVVVNADAPEFVDWLENNNLMVKREGRPHLMRADMVAGGAGDTALPGLVVMTELAFEKGGKEDFIDRLTSFEPRKDSFRVVLPPVVLSTEPWDAQGEWYDNGKRLADMAAEAASPIIIVGPAARMNRYDDQLFPTTLSGGYTLAAHFLKGAPQQIVIPNVAESFHGRFAVIGGMAAGITPKLEAAFWPPPGGDYSFAADFYLYLILVIEASIVANNGQLNAQQYFDCFWAGPGNYTYKSSKALNNALIGGGAYQFSLSNQISQQDDQLNGVRLFKGNNSDTKIQDGQEDVVVTNIGWFNVARRRLMLP